MTAEFVHSHTEAGGNASVFTHARHYRAGVQAVSLGDDRLTRRLWKPPSLPAQSVFSAGRAPPLWMLPFR